MLPKDRRISIRDFPKDTRGAFRAGTRYFSVVFLRKANRADDTTCAVVVSGKTAKLAVERNKIRRRTYDALARALPHIINGLTLVFYAKTEARHASMREIEDDILHSAKTAGILRR